MAIYSDLRLLGTTSLPVGFELIKTHPCVQPGRVALQPCLLASLVHVAHLLAFLSEPPSYYNAVCLPSTYSRLTLVFSFALITRFPVLDGGCTV